MDIKLHWTPEIVDHIAKHNVHKDGVHEVLHSRAFYSRRAGPFLTVIGKTHNRFLFTVLKRSRTVPEDFEVVTSRDASASEKALFLRRGKGVQ